MENVEQFIDQLIDEKDLGLEDDVREQLKIDMINRLLDQIDRATVNALPEDKAIELADKLDDPDFSDEQVAEFVKNSGVDMERVTLETMMQFRMLYLGENENGGAEEPAVEADDEAEMVDADGAEADEGEEE